MIRVLIADQARLFRSGLAALLADEPDIVLGGEADDAGKVARVAMECAADVALVASELPGLDFFPLIEEMRVTAPECAVVVLAARSRPGDLRRAVAAGAFGFVLKDSSPVQLSDAIRRVARGERVVDPDLAYAELVTAPPPLTPRELDVLNVAAEGATVGEIAERLHLSPGTVRNYLARIVGKAGARTRVEAIAIARERGWLWHESVRRFNG
ncbi:response regulator transcription factor [Actinocorallia populi]|uniref:response regulator transcription factor n=1 Tax=Actinocorallia populi TaxID=2079200 RepID=UPI000D091D9E|nr:response regulator transcription factor [Actinocorallia populi]